MTERARPSRRSAIGGAAAGAVLGHVAWADRATAQTAAPAGPVFRPEAFGARGDGATNDTDAFVAMSAAVHAAGGGVIELVPRATYIVGKQRFLVGKSTPGDIAAEVLSYLPSRIIWLRGLGGGLTIRGNGARLRAADGLRYGTFDPATGRANDHKMPYMGNDVANPYDAMINLHDIAGPVRIENLELDGNSDRLVWGGQRGDTGWQLPGSGMLIEGCARVTIDRVESHHHPLDGLQCGSRESFTVSNSRFHNNCRLNGNLRSGANFVATDCDFDHAAKGAHYSAPAGGFDLEAEIAGDPIIAPRFTRCRFRHNRYQGMASDSGDVWGASFDHCLFWSGADHESNPIYVSRPHFTFTACTFGGPLIVLEPSIRDKRLPLFTACLFTDDPRQGSLDRTVNLDASNINVSSGGVMFRACRFLFTRTRVPGVASPRVVFDRCVLASAPQIYAVIAGTYRDCRITGARIDLGSSSNAYFEGRTTLNGHPVPPKAPPARA